MKPTLPCNGVVVVYDERTVSTQGTVSVYIYVCAPHRMTVAGGD